MTIKNSKLVSVVVTTYKREFFLKETIKSILDQTYKNIEIIIVNDDSDASISKVVENFNDTRIKLYEINHSGRPAVPRNFGAQKANGELIAFCDDDDIFMPNKIQKQVDEFVADSNLKLTYTNFTLIDENGESIEKLFTYDTPVSFNSQLYKNNVTFSSVMIDKDIISQGMLFDERIELKASEDFLFITNLVYLFPFKFVEDHLVKYRIHKNGISQRSSKNTLLKYYKRIFLCMHSFLKTKKINFFKFFLVLSVHLYKISKQIIYDFAKK